MNYTKKEQEQKLSSLKSSLANFIPQFKLPLKEIKKKVNEGFYGFQINCSYCANRVFFVVKVEDKKITDIFYNANSGIIYQYILEKIINKLLNNDIIESKGIVDNLVFDFDTGNRIKRTVKTLLNNLNERSYTSSTTQS